MELKGQKPQLSASQKSALSVRDRGLALGAVFLVSDLKGQYRRAGGPIHVNNAEILSVKERSHSVAIPFRREEAAHVIHEVNMVGEAAGGNVIERKRQA